MSVWWVTGLGDTASVLLAVGKGCGGVGWIDNDKPF
jgi:hypothetical protein